MTDDYAKAYLTTLYLLGKRGNEVQLPPEIAGAATPSREQLQLRQGLASEDRNVRAQWLARGIQDLLTDLRDRQLS